MRKVNLKLLVPAIIVLIAIPVTILLSQRVETFTPHAAAPNHQIAMGISEYAYGYSSKNEDAIVTQINTLCKTFGRCPASYTIWNNFEDLGAATSPRTTFPSQKILNALDQNHVTPIIFMASEGPQLHKCKSNDPSCTRTLQGAMKLSNKSIAQGSYDDYLKTWAQSAHNYGKPVILRYDQEMNGYNFPWGRCPDNNPGLDTSCQGTFFQVGNTPESFKASWIHIYNVIHPIAPNVKFFFAIIPGHDNPALYFPGAKYVDYMGFDPYQQGGKDFAVMANQYTSSTLALQAMPGAKNIPMIVSEAGIARDANARSDSINQMYNQALNKPLLRNVVGILYYDIGGYSLNVSPQVINDYKALGLKQDFLGSFNGSPIVITSPPPTQPKSINANKSISAQVLGKTLTITTREKFAGAISSLKWNGKEFINTWDHGREMQTAITLDGLGECMNPTEAGSLTDGSGQNSSSVLTSMNASSDSLQTTTLPAYWLKPGAHYTNPQNGHNYCGGYDGITKKPLINTAQNKTVVSDYAIGKNVQIGYKGVPNAIKYEVTETLPRNQVSYSTQAVAAFLDSDFIDFWIFDSRTGAISKASAGSINQNIDTPIIAATKNGNYALGVLGEEPNSNNPTNMNGPVYRFNKFLSLSPKSNATTILDCGFNSGGGPANPVMKGTYKYNCDLIVGTLDDVRKSMTQLAGQPPTTPPTGEPEPGLGDINNDGKIDLLDWNLLNACSIFDKINDKTLCPNGSDRQKKADLDGNGTVDQDDMTLWIREFSASANR